MTADLTEAVQRCETCQQIKLPKEPMMTYPVPTLPSQIVACDCFECDNQHYVVFVDLYSDSTELKKLGTFATSTLLEQLKQVFAIHGVPVTLISVMVLSMRPQIFTSSHKSRIISTPHAQSRLFEIKWKG